MIFFRFIARPSGLIAFLRFIFITCLIYVLGAFAWRRLSCAAKSGAVASTLLYNMRTFSTGVETGSDCHAD